MTVKQMTPAAQNARSIRLETRSKRTRSAAKTPTLHHIWNGAGWVTGTASEI